MTAMQQSAFEKLLRSGIDTFGLSVGDRSVALLYTYFQELRRWSKKVNLIARETGDEVIVENHFIDSLALLMLLDEAKDCLLDVGSGAGFPGLVCKIVRPEMGVDLVEPRLKRVSFLRHISRTCGLDTAVLAVRLEPGVNLERESAYTSVTGRAVSDIEQFLAICSRFNRAGTRVICMKGPKFRQELQQAEGKIDGWNLASIREYTLPFSGASRALLVFETAQNTKTER